MPFERGKVLHYGEAEMPWNMKVGGHIRKCRQEDELNSEKCGVADTLGRLALIGGKTPHNRLSRLCYCKKDLEFGLKEVEATAMMLKIPI